MEKEAQELIAKILSFANIKPDLVLDKTDLSLKIEIDCDDSALLIGRHGETLKALQYIVNIIWQKQNSANEDFKKIVLDVGNYRSQKEQDLKNLIQVTSQNVMRSGRVEVLPPMSAYERRLIHVALENNKDVMTESIGEGDSRRVIIKPR